MYTLLGVLVPDPCDLTTDGFNTTDMSTVESRNTGTMTASNYVKTVSFDWTEMIHHCNIFSPFCFIIWL